MLTKDLDRILAALESMAEAEAAVGEFYRACADVPGEDRSFWLQTAAEEEIHKKNVQKMKEMIARNPENFSLHRPFNAAATQTFLSFIRQNTGALRQNKIPGKKLLFIARDIERSLLEFAYFEIVKTADPGYGKILKEILAQTAAHKSRMEGKISATPFPH